VSAEGDGPRTTWLTTGQAAALLRIDPKTVARRADAGHLLCVRTLGGHRRLRESDVRALLNAGVPFDPGTGPVPGYVAGLCGHRVARSEWRAGCRTCERCPDPTVT
jgi:excisionase family DNA binding protein